MSGLGETETLPSGAGKVRLREIRTNPIGLSQRSTWRTKLLGIQDFGGENWRYQKGALMAEDKDTLIALLGEVSRQSEPFQSLIRDYSLDVIRDSEVHRLFATRLNNDVSMLRRISNLKKSFALSSAEPNGISAIMNEVLEAASALSAASHTSMAEIVNLVAVELAYRRIDQGLDEPLVASEMVPNHTPS
jgi:hypothetical protein